VLNIFVGGQNGYNGGGSGGINGNSVFNGASSGLAGNGGGASDIRTGGSALVNRIIVAGGGGGGASNGVWTSCQTAGPAGNGGAGGGLAGGNGTMGSSSACNCTGGGGNGGNGGTALAGGAAGTYNTGGCLQSWAAGSAGTLGNGGVGSLIFHNGSGGCGGGGGGFYGGGAGGNGSDTTPGGGGGGGSAFVGTLTNTVVTAGIRIGNGIVIFTYNFNGAGVAASASGYSVCSGSAVTLSASNVLSYTWAPGGSNSSSISVSPTSNTTYTVQGTNSLGCISNSVLTVTVDAGLPVISVLTSTNSLCAGKPATLTASGATTYTWTGSVTNGISFMPPVSSSYTVTGANACGTATASSSITVNPAPNVTASANNPTVCNGSAVILNGGGSVSGYTWTSGVLNNTSFIPPATNVYTVTGIAANGCTAIAVAGVTVLVTPNIPPVVTPTAICLGQTAILSAQGATGYTWTPGTALNSFTAAVSPAIPTGYTVFRSNGACTSTASVFLQVNPLPNIVATASPTVICVGDPVVLNVIGGITYTWVPNNFSASNFVLFPNASSNYTVTASNGSCTASGIVQFSVNPSPVVGINTPTFAVCAGSSVVLTATGNAPTYTWLPGPVIGNTFTVTPTATALYTLMGTNASNCTSQQTQLIIANPRPVLTLTSSIPFACSGQAAALSIVNATMPNVTYNWINNTGVGTSYNVTPTVTTSYFATGTNTLTGCNNTNTLTLSVFISTFVVSSPTAICRGSSAILNASGAANSYTWIVNGGTFTPSVSVSPSLTTNYTIIGLTGNCTSSLVVTVIVNSLPNVNATATKPQLCRLEFGTVTASGANTYTWNTGAATPAISYNTLTVTTTFTVTGTDLNGCVKTNTVTQFIATCIGIDALTGNTNLGLDVYPNPNNGNFTIGSQADIKISIVNTLGQVVHTTQLSKNDKKDIAVSTLPNGVYFITGESNGLKVTKKIIIEK